MWEKKNVCGKKQKQKKKRSQPSVHCGSTLSLTCKLPKKAYVSTTARFI